MIRSLNKLLASLLALPHIIVIHLMPLNRNSTNNSTHSLDWLAFEFNFLSHDLIRIRLGLKVSKQTVGFHYWWEPVSVFTASLVQQCQLVAMTLM